MWDQRWLSAKSKVDRSHGVQGGRWEVRDRYVFGCDKQLDLGAPSNDALSPGVHEPFDDIEVGSL